MTGECGARVKRPDYSQFFLRIVRNLYILTTLYSMYIYENATFS
jgi:hypothetical protein